MFNQIRHGQNSSHVVSDKVLFSDGHLNVWVMPT